MLGVVPIMFVRRFPAARAASSCCVALRFFQRPRILTEPGLLPTTACDTKASVGRFDATVPLQPAASVATAASPAYGEPPTNNSRQPCNFTQEKLMALKRDINKGEVDFSDYFFNVACKKGRWEKRKLQYNLSDDDDMDRCIDCGLKISEHRDSTSTVGPVVANYIKSVVAHFVECVNSGKHEEALDHYRNWMRNVSRSVEGEYCAPMKVKQSWGGDIWKMRLIEARKGLAGLDKNETRPRAPRVLGIHAGTGSGKTHALLDAAQHLEATTAIYVTYNMGQNLKLDQNNASIASLLRILLRHPSNKNLSNLSCDEAFECCEAELSQLARFKLLDFVVSYIVEQGQEHEKSQNAKEKGHETRAAHVVAVDEIRKLMATSDTPVLQTISMLGLLASMLEGNGVKCTVIVSALTESAFVTMSDRLSKCLSHNHQMTFVTSL